MFENFRFCDKAMARNAVGGRLKDFITFRRCRRSGTLGGDAGRALRNTPYAHHRARPWRARGEETRSSVVFEYSAVTGDRVCLALIAFHRPGARGGAEVRRR